MWERVVWSFIIVLSISCTNNPTISPESNRVTSWYGPIDNSGPFGMQLGTASSLEEGWSDSTISLEDQSISLLLEMNTKSARYQEFKMTYAFDSSMASNSFIDIRDHLASLYGRNSPTDGYSTWRTSSTNGNLIEVELIDGQILFDRPEIICVWRLREDRLYED